MKRAQKIEYAQLMEHKIALNKKNKLARMFETMYDWQHRFNAATKTYSSCMLMAANQVGKTRTGTIIDAHHLTGDYPEDWEGFELAGNVTVWLLGYSGEKVRDLLQNKIFGRLNTVTRELEGGLVTPDKIIDYKSMSGTPGACREIRVRRKDGGIAVCQLWSYSQGQHALMGDVVDWYHIDEEPKDPEIYPQVITRTLNGNKGKGGRGILTFTPENGKTEMVTSFMDAPSRSMYLQRATWDDAKHLSDDVKEGILAQYPAYQRDMRSKGEPLMGSGLIFEIGEDQIKCEPFEIPSHWFVINGMDFGWDHPQAHIQLVWDKEADMFYLVNAWKGSRLQPYEAWHIVSPWAEYVPVAWPADGLQHKQQQGKEALQQKALYEIEGFNMLPAHTTWEDGGNGVWVGIMELTNLMKTGRLKVFSNLHEVFAEIRQYHTKTTINGKIEIVKVLDDLLDAIRYAYMMRRYAMRIFDLIPEDYAETFHTPQEGYTGD